MQKKALIIGISGQDGSYLADYLISLGYEVHGTIKQNFEAILYPNISHLENKIILHTTSLEAFPQMSSIIRKVKPDECYILAAKSFVSYNFETEFDILNTNITGVHNILSSIYEFCNECKIYFAGSSEMFGNVQESPQNENTIFNPRSIYGISKVTAHYLVKNYRENYGLYICTGILYNHESPRRGIKFVTRKITSTAAKIKLGIEKNIELGSIDAIRDWGYAKEYVEAMHSMLQLDEPEDFVLGTGIPHTVKDFVEISFSELNLDYKKYLMINPKFIRKDKGMPLIADATKAKKTFSWKPKTSFHELITMMIRHDYDMFKKQL